MKVFENIKTWESENINANQAESSTETLLAKELNRVITDLIPLRKNRLKTRQYYDSYLRYTTHVNEFYRSLKERELNGETITDWNYKPMEGECTLPEDALHSALLRIIDDDKYSFGHLYWLLGSEVNRECGFELYTDIVLPNEVIDYAVDFDLDDLKSAFFAMKSPMERRDFAMRQKAESMLVLNSENNPILAKLKKAYESTAGILIDFSNNELSLDGSAGKIKGTTMTDYEKLASPQKPVDDILYDLNLCSDPRFSSLKTEVHGACMTHAGTNVMTFATIVTHAFAECYTDDIQLEKNGELFNLFPRFVQALMESYRDNLSNIYKSNHREILKKMYGWCLKTYNIIDNVYQYNKVIGSSYPYSGESGELEFPSADTYLFKRALLQPIYQYFFMITKPFQQNLPSKLKDVVPFNMWLNEFEGLKKSYTGQFGLDLKKRAVVNVDDNKLRFSDALAEDCLTFCKRMSAHSTAPNRKVALDSDTSILTEKLHTMFRDYIDRIRLVCQDPKIIDKGILNWLLTLELVVYDSYSVKQDYVKERVAESYMLDKNITYFYFDICMKNVFEMANDYFKDSKKIPLVSPNPNNTLKNQNKSDADVPTIMHSCEINYRLLHKEWNNTALYKVSLKQLTDAIDYANFFDLFNKAEKAGKRAGFIGSLRYIMIILHKKLGDSWYMAACKSIGTTPDQNDKQHRNTKKIKDIELSLLDECIEEKSDVD